MLYCSFPSLQYLLRKNQLVLTTLLLLAVTACGGGGDSDASGTSARVASTYFPASNTSVAYEHTTTDTIVSVTDSERTYNAVTQNVINFDTGDKLYFSSDASGFSLTGFYLPEVMTNVGSYTADINFNNGISLWSTSAPQGSNSVSVNGTVDIQPIYGEQSISVSGSATYSGLETIAVASASYDALVVSFSLSATTNVQGVNITIPYNFSLWFVEDIGLVQFEVSGEMFRLRGTDSGGNPQQPAVTDSDGVVDQDDTFPNDSTESSDSDGDGVGDNLDAFPADASETLDSDGDGTGDNSDAFPNNATYSETINVPATVVAIAPVLGSSEPVSEQITITGGSNIPWVASSSEAWLTLSASSGVGQTILICNVDTSGLILGHNDATISIINLVDNSVHTVDFDTNIVLPTLSVDVENILFDASMGWGGIVSQDVNLSLNTGTNNYSLTQGSNITSGDLTVALSASDVGESDVTASVGLDAVTFSEGEHAGTITFSSIVLGHTISTDLPITVIASKHVLRVPDQSVALADFVTTNKLSHQVDVLDSYGLLDTSWDAVSDQTWLSITASGTTTDKLLLTASSASIAVDQLHTATVTLSSSNSAIEGSVSFKVGFWVGSSDPTTDDITVQYQEITADPLRPYVYVHNAGDNIDVYNVYNQVLVRSISVTGTTLGDMEVSENGAYLFVSDLVSGTIKVIDLADNDSLFTSYAANNLSSGFALSNSQEKLLLISSSVDIYDALTGVAYTQSSWPVAVSSNSTLDASLYGNRFCGINRGISPYDLYCYELLYSSYNNSIVTEWLGDVPHGTGSNGKDVALNKDGSLVYVASGSPYAFTKVNVDSMLPVSSLTAGPYPASVEISSLGVVHGAVGSLYGPEDVWFYTEDESLLSSSYSSGYAKRILDRGLAVSGDEKITVVITDDPKISFVSQF